MSYPCSVQNNDEEEPFLRGGCPSVGRRGRAKTRTRTKTYVADVVGQVFEMAIFDVPERRA
jgi:hypothetical protein